MRRIYRKDFTTVACFLAPSALLRLDRHLLRNHPLLWRSRVHWVAWWTVIADLIAVVLGNLVPNASQQILTLGELNTLRLAGYACSVIAVGVWGGILLETPIGERRVGEHVRFALLNALIVLSLLVPPTLFRVAAMHRTANAVTDAVLDADEAFFERRRLWCCTGNFHESALENEMSELRQVLQSSYGLGN